MTTPDQAMTTPDQAMTVTNRSRRLAVITIVRGRHQHLIGQLAGLAASRRLPDIYVAVAMDDPEVAAICAMTAVGIPQICTATIGPSGDGDLPMAAARNLGARTALDAGADDLVFLDVDCIPGPTLTERYSWGLATAYRLVGLDTPVLLCGDVAYLPPSPATTGGFPLQRLEALAEPHPARPALGPLDLVLEDDLNRFWSLSFAMSAEDWKVVCGFCEDYTGYGGEDTDFAQRVGAAGGRLIWVGGTKAYHQYHPSPSPPLQHLISIVRNANTFHEHWGWHPMLSWLREFEALGLARRDSDGKTWVVTGGPHPSAVVEEPSLAVS